MDDWKPIDSAPHDGTPIWVAVQYRSRYFPSTIIDGPLISVFCRYDSWEQQFRKAQSGETLDPVIEQPLFWCSIHIPKPPPNPRPLDINSNT